MDRQPDYSNAIPALMAAIGEHLRDGGAVTTPGGAELRSGKVALIVIDGLGSALLERHRDSYLYRLLKGHLSSVFPSTTASAMTSYMTGVAPSQHGITGWFMWLKEIGCVTTVLPFVPRYKGLPLSESGIRPEMVTTAAPFASRLGCESEIIYPGYIVNSPYTVDLSGDTRRNGFEDLEAMFQILVERAVTGSSRYLLSYWPGLDALAHEHGIYSEVVARHFNELDALAAHYLPQLAANGYEVLLSADHGQVETDPEHTVELQEHEPLQQMLTLPLCGEPRAAYAYVHAHRREAFEEYVRDQLAQQCELYASEQLIEAGWFGPQPVAKQLYSRVGDYVLLMRGNWIIRDQLMTERPFTQRGVHGGNSREEMEIPLLQL